MDGGFKKPWCSTSVDSYGNHVRGTWGDCDPAALEAPPLLHQPAPPPVSSPSSSMERSTRPAPTMGASPRPGAAPRLTATGSTSQATLLTAGLAVLWSSMARTIGPTTSATTISINWNYI